MIVRDAVSQGYNFSSGCRKRLGRESGSSNLGLLATDEYTMISSPPFLKEYGPFQYSIY